MPTQSRPLDAALPAGTGVTPASDGSPAPLCSAASANLMLVLATVGFLVNFWAWALISPLGAAYRGELHLSPFQQSLLVALPVLVGSLGRIPVGALTDRFGARVMFPIVSFLTILPVLFVGLVGDSYARLLLGGFFLGIAGTAFAVGVPFVNAWFPPARRGLALGLFGIGMGGTAISAFTTVRLADAHGRSTPFVLVAIVLAVYGAVALVLLRDAPNRLTPTGGFLGRLLSTLRLPATIQLSALYAVGFGGFVAFAVYLPTYLKTAYDLTPGDAANRTAGFVVLAVAMRPVGGWLSDRFHPVPVLTVCFSAVFALATVASFELDLMPLGTIAFLGLAAALGAASGGVFALVARLAPPTRVGSVTGVVGAAGGLGGFIPPLVMGSIYGRSGDYSLGYVLLAIVALGAAVYTATVVRRGAR
jgi:NNP family nitrate/nitrite transporter-like MFS transporter